MYGLIVENWTQYITVTYGEEKWNEIRRMAKIEHSTFNSHSVYADNLIPRLTAKACKILNVTEKDFLKGMGKFFVGYIGQYGYDRVLSVLGRNMRDFLNGLDNLHEYLKFSYPRMKAPSFFCENETSTGLILHYRSTRRGFLWYTVGQIKEVGSHFYNTDVCIEVIKEETVFDTQHVMFQLTFDNRAFQLDQNKLVQKVEKFMLPIKAQIFLEIFPFCIVFDQNLVIKTIGNSLSTILPTIVNRKLLDIFDINRPLIESTWRAILSHTNNIFELTTVDPVFRLDIQMKLDKCSSNSPDHFGKFGDEDEEDETRVEDKLLHLKGQMMYMDEWKSMAYLGTPVMRDLNAMIHTGLYINDLSMHDFSRDMVLAGQQQSAELKLALDQELTKSKQLEDSMRKLDVEMKRTDELLYQMIPKQVADRLRKGEASVNTCQFFDAVTILFSDVVTFTEICSRITPMQVVSLLNSMYSLFDQLTGKHEVYKVETIGDAYMVVSGAPQKDEKHAEKISQMALDMVQVIGGLKDPSTGQSIRIRVGVHSGAVVAGVVGLKMPRYCLFGDAVNTASRMESTSEALKIHISERTRELLVPGDWNIEERGTTTVKGKGEMKTYWLVSRTSDSFSKASLVEHDENEGLISTGSGNGNIVSDNSIVSDTPVERVSTDQITRYTPVQSTTASSANTNNDAVVTYFKEPNNTSLNQGTQAKINPSYAAPQEGIVTKAGNHHVTVYPKSLTEGLLQAWGPRASSGVSNPTSPNSSLDRPGCHHHHHHHQPSSGVCVHCHFGGQMRQLSELVSQHHSMLHESATRNPEGDLCPIDHDHYKSQTCSLF